MTHHFTDMSSQHSNLEKGMEHSDHMKQIRATLGIYLIFENKSIMSEVDWKPKVGCFLRSRVKSFCIGLQVVDCKLILGHFGTKWGRIGTPNWLPRVLAIFQWLFHSKLKTLLFRKSYPDSSSSAYLPPRLSSKHHSRLNVCLPT